MGFLTKAQLDGIGFRHLGRDVRLSDRASLYNPSAISLGDCSRIDDFCVLSAGRKGIRIGRHVHVAVYCSLIGAEAITLEDFAGISSRCSIYSSSDDFGGDYLTGPTVPDELRNVTNGPVTLGKHVVVGAGSVILPGVSIGEGAAIGAMSLITRNCAPFGIYSGIPAQRKRDRNRALLELEKRLGAEE